MKAEHLYRAVKELQGRGVVEVSIRQYASFPTLNYCSLDGGRADGSRVKVVVREMALPRLCGGMRHETTLEVDDTPPTTKTTEVLT